MRLLFLTPSASWHMQGPRALLELSELEMASMNSQVLSGLTISPLGGNQVLFE